jgi:hypothetical protein
MTAADDVSKRDLQMKKIYEALGRFLVEFSKLLFAMQSDIALAVGGEYAVMQTVLVEMTADPMIRAWRSAVTQVASAPPGSLSILADVTDEIRRLIQLRNDWAHGYWFVGWGNDATVDWSHADLWRLKNSARGVALPTSLDHQPTADSIEKMADHVSVLADAVRHFTVLIMTKRVPVSIEMVRYSKRIRITKERRHRTLQVTTDGANWRTTEWDIPK